MKSNLSIDSNVGNQRYLRVVGRREEKERGGGEVGKEVKGGRVLRDEG